MVLVSKPNAAKVKKRYNKYQQTYAMASKLSFLTQFWQDVTELPESLRNGKNILLEENIQHRAEISADFKELTLDLDLLTQRISNKTKNYVVVLQLLICEKENVVAIVKMTLLTEVSWCEFFKSYHK